MGKQRRYTQYVCLALLATPLAPNIPRVPRAQIFQRTPSVGDRRPSERGQGKRGLPTAQWGH